MKRGLALSILLGLVQPESAWAVETRAAKQEQRRASAYHHEEFRGRFDLGIGRLAAYGRAEGRSDRRVSATTLSWSFAAGGAITETCTLGGMLAIDRAHAVAARDERSGPIDMTGVDIDQVFWGPHIDCYLTRGEGPRVFFAAGPSELNVDKDGESAEGYDGGDPSPDPSGFGYLIGVGYDRFVGKELSLGLVARLMYAPLSVRETDVEATVHTFIPMLGLSLTLD
ncbi:MAG: hypothetical protein KJ015_29895 [Myxococcales bacterium]|nr:hypothetical protein [Myxococcales bacterium]